MDLLERGRGYDPADPRIVADPHRTHSLLRAFTPQFTSDRLGCLVVLDYATARDILRRPATFRPVDTGDAHKSTTYNEDAPVKADLPDAVESATQRQAAAIVNLLRGRDRSDLLPELCGPVAAAVTSGQHGHDAEALEALLASVVFAVVSNPSLRSELAGLVDDRGALDRAVEELVRLHCGVSVLRVANHDTVVRQRTVAEGGRVLVVVPSANRDGNEFLYPDRTILGRELNRHLAFGTREDPCLVRDAARGALRGMLRELVRQPSLTLDTDADVTFTAGLVRAPTSIPVVLPPTA